MAMATRRATAHETLLALASQDPSAFEWRTDASLCVEHLSGGMLSVIALQISGAVGGLCVGRSVRAGCARGPCLGGAHRAALADGSAVCEFVWGGWQLRAHIVATHDSAGRVVGCLGLAHHAAEGGPLESALDESERRFEALVQLAPAGIYLTDASGACTYVNRRWCEMAGLDVAQALGHGWEAAIHPEDREHVVNAWYEAARNQGPWELEYRLQTPSGATTWVWGHATALREDSGQLRGFLGINVDITHRKETQRKLWQIIESAPDAMIDL